MKERTKSILHVGIIALIISACFNNVYSQAPSDATTDKRNISEDSLIAQLHRDWILIGWEKKEGEKFDYTAKLGKYYDWKEKDVILYDDFDPQKRIAKSAAEYKAVWEPGFSTLKSARHRIVYGPHVLVSEKIASSTLQFEADITNADGKVTKIRTFTSLVWKKTAGGWKIVREHNSTVVLPK
jgi:ketosteroid isomerase-like protein